MGKLIDYVNILDSQRIPISAKERSTRKKIYPYYGAQGIVDYIDDFIFDGEYILVAEDGENLRSLNQNIATWATGKFWVNNHAHILGYNGKANLKYIYYLLSSMDLRKFVTGSAQPKLNQYNLANIQFDLPPKETQDKIAALLGALDDKITLNKKINATLETMAKTLYDYWFFQFDFPDEHGRPYKSSGGKMIYSSELGRDIPKGWTVATLGDLITENATPFNSQTAEPTIDLSVMPSASISLDRLNISSMFSINLFKMTEGDILFGSIRPYLKKAGIAPCDGVVVGTVHSYRAKKESDYTFALFTICHDNFFDYAVKVSTGTRMPIISSESLLSYKVAYSENIAKIFNMPDLRRTICKNVQESQRLAELRDWLLPLLMNGQVSV